MRQITEVRIQNGIKVKDCLDCKAVFPLNEFGANGKFRNGKLKYKPRCNKCVGIHERNVFYEKLFNIVGGKEYYKCSMCGYNKSYGALEFHHTDSTTKDKNISKMRNYSEQALKKEIKKCILICANCHREVHEELNQAEHI